MPLGEREQFLNSITPHINSGDLLHVKPVIIGLILQTNVTSRDSLKRMLGLGCKFGAFCRNNSPDGRFVPARDFTEDRLSDYDTWAHAHVKVGSAATYMATLRKLSGRQPKRRPKGRRVAGAPYSPARVSLLWDACQALDEWVSTEMRTLQSLAFGVGARSEEINQMRASQIETSGRTTTVNITRRGVLREVPVYGYYADWLTDRAAELHPDDYLFHPNVTARSDAIGDLVRTAAERSTVFYKFSTARARHTWIWGYLQLGVSYNVLRTAADVGPGSNLFADLSPHLPPMSPTQVRRAFDAVQDRHKDL